MEISTSKTGKHGHAKANITGIDIFNGRKYEDCVPTSHNCEEPILKRLEYQVLSINADDYVSLYVTDTGEMREDLKLPDDTDADKELSERIRDGVEEGKNIYITVLSSMNIEKIIEMQEKNN